MREGRGGATDDHRRKCDGRGGTVRVIEKQIELMQCSAMNIDQLNRINSDTTQFNSMQFN